MANYSLVTQGSYNPFTYDELLKPVAAYTQEYNTQQEALSNLATMANVWKNKANEQTDSRTYAQYKKYSDDLKAQADSLASRGISTTSRQTLMDLKARYGDEIKSIEDAYNRRAKLAEEQRKGKAAGLIYDYDAATTSLDKFVFDNQKDYDTIDLNKVYTKSVATFGTLAKELADYGQGKKVDSFTNSFVQQHGITRDKARQFIEAVNSGKLDTADPVLRGMYNSLYNSTGVSKWNNKESESQVSNTILSAVGASIGQTQVSTFANEAAKQAAEIENYRKKKEIDTYYEKLKNGQNGEGNLQIIPTPLRNQREIGEQRKQLQDYINKGYIKEHENGKLEITPEGRKALTHGGKTKRVYANTPEAKYVPKGTKLETSGNLSWYTVPDRDDSFNNFMLKVSGNKAFWDPNEGKYLKGMGPGQVGNMLNNYQGSFAGYDVNRTTAYDRQLTGEYAKQYKNQWLLSNGTMGLQEANYGNNGYEYSDLAKQIDTSKLDKWDVSRERTYRDKKTGKLHKSLILTSDTETTADGRNWVEVKFNAENVNLPARDLTSRALEMADQYSDAMRNRYAPKFVQYPNGVIDVERDRRGNVVYDYSRKQDAQSLSILDQAQKYYLNTMQFASDQTVTASKTKTEEITPSVPWR